MRLTDMNYNNYLCHYGIKGMKWGVRRYQYSNGIYTDAGRRRYGVGPRQDSNTFKSKPNNKNQNDFFTPRKKRIIRNVLIGTAAVTAASVVGLELYKLGKMNADLVIRAKTDIQSIAVREKNDWDNSFYAAVARDDRNKILKSFSKDTAKRAKLHGLSGEVNANIFRNDKDVKIAGRKAFKKAYKRVYGTTKGFNKYSLHFGAYSEEKRRKVLNELKKRGYGGVKDLDGMAKWWGGSTPVVLNGSESGFKLQKSSPINLNKLGKLKIKDTGGKLRRIEENNIRATKILLGAAGGVQVSSLVSNQTQKAKSDDEFKRKKK